MAFDKYTNYNDTAGVSGVVFSSEKPVLEVELNEVQEVQKSLLRRTIKNLLGNGITDKKAISFNNGVLSIADGCSFAINGFLVQCTGLSIDVINGETVYLQVWEETVGHSSVLKKEGNEQATATVTNYMKDSRFPIETTRRRVVKYTLSTSTNATRQNLAIASILNGRMTLLVKEVNLSKLNDRVIDLQMHMGLLGDGILGLECDLDNNTFKRIGDNEFWTAGDEYEKSPIYANRKRCNVTDDGVVVAFYGDLAYTETGALTTQVVGTDGNTYPIGTKVQCMVMQPKFYYRRIPLRLTKQVSANYKVTGYHLTKWVDLISPTPRDGFKVHPAFIKGDEVLDYYFIGENDGCIENNAGEYDLTDSMSLPNSPYTGYKFSSIANAKPSSGATVAGVSPTGNKKLTRTAVRQMCANRGADWQQLDITILSAEQMLFIIEYATFSSQTTIMGSGSVNIPFVENINNSAPNPVNTTLGNKSGNIESSYVHSNGITYTPKIAVYRGVKNPYGNIWKYVDGLLRDLSTDSSLNEVLWQDGSKALSDEVSEHISSGFSMLTTSSYVKGFGYSEDCDFMYLPSLGGGSSVRPVGDYLFTDMTDLKHHICLVGARHNYDAEAGMFCYASNGGVGVTQYGYGGRLCRKSANVPIVV